MPSTHELRCRRCNVGLVLLSEKTRGVECPTCRTSFSDDVLRSFAQYEIVGTCTEPVFEISSLPDGQPTAKPRQDLLDDLRRRVVIVEKPDRKTRTVRF